MEGIRTSIDNHGKILIPARLRKELNFRQGDTIVVRKVDNELRLVSLSSVLEKIQQDFKSRSKDKKPAVKEFLESKQLEHELEESQLNQFGNKHE